MKKEQILIICIKVHFCIAQLASTKGLTFVSLTLLACTPKLQFCFRFKDDAEVSVLANSMVGLNSFLRVL
jgi:hypothetical protein